MITRLIWITWTPMCAVGKRPLDLIIHSIGWCKLSHSLLLALWGRYGIHYSLLGEADVTQTDPCMMTSSCEMFRVFHCFTFVILSIIKWMQLNDLPAILHIGVNSMITRQLLFWHENQLSATDHVLSGSRVSVNDISLHSNATVGVDSRFQIVPQGIRAINDKITSVQLRLLIRNLQLRRQTYFCAAQLEMIVIQEVAYAAPASLNHEWHAKYRCLVKNEKWAWHLSHNRKKSINHIIMTP